MKKFFNPLILATALAATACTNTEDGVINDDPANKTAISFSVEENQSPVTRAGFTADTKIAMRIKSTDGSATVYTRAVAKASAQETGNSYSKVELTDKRYWDDAFGRAANLSVYAIAVPGSNDTSTTTFEEKLAGGTTTWFSETPENENVSWGVTTTEQTNTTIAAEDLTYSNNIQSGGKDGVYRYDFENDTYPTYSTDLADGCMKFSQKTNAAADAPGKFDKGHLIFNHALSRITINLSKGEGFGSNAFEFKSGTNVTIKSVPTSGTLNLATGEWTNSKTDITKMYQSATVAHTSYSLMAQFLPDYVITDGSNTNMLEFTIDDNKYYVTQDQMFDALNGASDKTNLTITDGNKVIMAQGINYIFNIKVNKTGVNVTATVVPFANVTAAGQEITNDKVSLTLHTVSGTASTSFDLYRSVVTSNYDQKNWSGDYEKHTTDLTNDNDTWKTDWFFESNLTYYHFRTVNKGTTVIKKDGETDVDDYFSIEAGSVSAKDYHWGAPMTSEPVYKTEDNKGYSDCLSLAIGATSSAIAIADLHVMSKIVINLATTTGSDAVTLAGSKVTITQVYGTGKVLMGSGLVSATGAASASLEMDGNPEGTEFTYAVIPQSLVRSTTPTESDYVIITIETGDGNKYTIKTLSSILDSKSKAITTWLPGYSYTYSFTLKKTGITNVTATVKDWANVTAKDADVTLE